MVIYHNIAEWITYTAVAIGIIGTVVSILKSLFIHLKTALSTIYGWVIKFLELTSTWSSKADQYLREFHQKTTTWLHETWWSINERIAPFIADYFEKFPIVHTWINRAFRDVEEWMDHEIDEFFTPGHKFIDGLNRWIEDTFPGLEEGTLSLLEIAQDVAETTINNLRAAWDAGATEIATIQEEMMEYLNRLSDEAGGLRTEAFSRGMLADPEGCINVFNMFALTPPPAEIQQEFEERHPELISRYALYERAMYEWGDYTCPEQQYIAQRESQDLEYIQAAPIYRDWTEVTLDAMPTEVEEIYDEET